MSGRKGRVDWTTFEQAQFYAAVVDLLKTRKIVLPISTSKDRTEFLKVCRDAQVALAENRRRPSFNSLDNVTGDLRKRFVDNGVLPRNVDALKKGHGQIKVDEAPDPREEAIKGLQAELLAYKQKETDLLEQVQGLIDANMQLRNQPTPLQMLQRVIAETIALAMQMHDDKHKPAFMRVPSGGAEVPPKAGDAPSVERRVREDLPQFEKDRRKDPQGYMAGAPSATSKPKFALVADFVGSDKALLHQKLSDIAELRYLDSSSKFGGLKTFHSNHGRVIVWADHCPHDWQRSITAMGVTFHAHRGTSVTGLAQHIKDTVEKLKGLK